MIKHMDAQGEGTVTFSFEGNAIDARPCDTVASALLAAGEKVFRETAVSTAPRGPFCLMGSCFECLVEVDGVRNRQACMLAISDGMVVRRQHGAS